MVTHLSWSSIYFYKSYFKFMSLFVKPPDFEQYKTKYLHEKLLIL